MDSLHLFFIVIFFFNILITAWAENAYYVVSIKRNDNDKNFDDESKVVQTKIVELVNDRMNDIYEIIENNLDSYRLENGEMDEKLNEISTSLKKRQEEKPFKYKFINRNRPYIDIEDNIINKKRSLNSTIEYIPFDSDLISFVCPILNYYTIKVYLSDAVKEKISHLLNVERMEKAILIDNFNTVKRERVKIEDLNNDNYASRNDNKNISNYNYTIGKNNKYYNVDMIKEETNWSGVLVQEEGSYQNINFFSHLSLLSQSKYYQKNTASYDNNYYFPESAGYGIDIFLIDGGIDMAYSEDYNTYRGRNYERNISCDTVIYGGESFPTTGKKKKQCEIVSIYGSSLDHGMTVASVAAGALYGVAKKANIHMIATDLYSYDALVALDFIKEHGTPYKGVINISRGGWSEYSVDLQNKLTEVSEAGYIIFAAVGNDGDNSCEARGNQIKYYAMYDNVIVVGATEDTTSINMNDAYKVAHYSDYGKCIDIHAPGQAITPSPDPLYRVNGYYVDISHGTSVSSPIVAGVAATIMSENPDIQYDFELMKQTLIDLSLKDVLTEFRSYDTPNRLVNNGKHLVFSPKEYYNGCGINSPVKNCLTGCCSKYGTCIDPLDDQFDFCYVGQGCQSEFGICNQSRATKFLPEPTPTLYEDPEPTIIYPKMIPNPPKSIPTSLKTLPYPPKTIPSSLITSSSTTFTSTTTTTVKTIPPIYSSSMTLSSTSSESMDITTTITTENITDTDEIPIISITKTLAVTTSSINTLPIITVTSTTKTVPVTTTSTNTKTVPITTTSTNTKTVPITTTSTNTKTIPITITSTNTKTVQITTTSINTKIISITTTSTKTVPVTTTTTTKNIISTKSSITTKSTPTTTTTTTKSTTSIIPITSTKTITTKTTPTITTNTKTITTKTTPTTTTNTKTITTKITPTTTTNTKTITTKITPTTTTVPSKTLPKSSTTTTTKTVPTSSKTIPTTTKITSSKAITTTTTTTTPFNPQPTQDSNINIYLSCEQYDWDCRQEMSIACYQDLDQCWRKPWSSEQSEKCGAINEICSKIWA